MHHSWLIRGATILDPSAAEPRTADLYVRDGRIAPALERPGPDVPVIDAQGLWLTPGLIDVHVHFRQPGNEEAETIESGCRAAAAGGFTRVVTMPNTSPATDTPELIADVLRLGREAGLTGILPSGCITRGRNGRELADLAGMAVAGACAFTDDGSTVADDDLMLRGMQAAAALGRPVLDHALDQELSGGGVMHAGETARRLGLPGIPSSAETSVVDRDIELCRRTGCAVHIQHVSARGSVELIRAARREGLPVSGEATPHHLALADTDIPADDAAFKMNPPLRGKRDREALLTGVADGTLQALATDHAPHLARHKQHGFRAAPFGIVGLETAVGVTYTCLVLSGRMSRLEWIRRWTAGPAAVLGLPAPDLAPGAPADIALLDLDSAWTVNPDAFLSLSHNTPFASARLTGRCMGVLSGGRLTWERNSLGGTP